MQEHNDGKIFYSLVYIQNRLIKLHTITWPVSLFVFLLFLIGIKPSFKNFTLVSLPILVGIISGIYVANLYYKTFQKYTDIFAEGGKAFLEIHKSFKLNNLKQRLRFWLIDSPKIFWKTDLSTIALVRFIILVLISFAVWYYLFLLDAFRDYFAALIWLGSLLCWPWQNHL